MFSECTTDGCENRGVFVPVPADAGIVICGPCGYQITSFTDTLPEPVTEVPEWLL